MSRLSYRMTYRPESARCLRKVSGQGTIEAVAPKISNIPGSTGSPKAWVHRSTPLVLIIRCPASSSTSDHSESFIVIFLFSDAEPPRAPQHSG